MTATYPLNTKYSRWDEKVGFLGNKTTNEIFVSNFVSTWFPRRDSARNFIKFSFSEDEGKTVAFTDDIILTPETGDVVPNGIVSKTIASSLENVNHISVVLYLRGFRDKPRELVVRPQDVIFQMIWDKKIFSNSEAPLTSITTILGGIYNDTKTPRATWFANPFPSDVDDIVDTSTGFYRVNEGEDDDNEDIVFDSPPGLFKNIGGFIPRKSTIANIESYSIEKRLEHKDSLEIPPVHERIAVGIGLIGISSSTAFFSVVFVPGNGLEKVQHLFYPPNKILLTLVFSDSNIPEQKRDAIFSVDTGIGTHSEPFTAPMNSDKTGMVESLLHIHVWCNGEDNFNSTIQIRGEHFKWGMDTTSNELAYLYNLSMSTTGFFEPPPTVVQFMPLSDTMILIYSEDGRSFKCHWENVPNPIFTFKGSGALTRHPDTDVLIILADK